MNLDRSLRRYESYEENSPRGGIIVTRSTLKNHEKNISSPLTENFQPILIISRLFGCHPHGIFSKKIVRTSRFLKGYSIICGFIAILPIAREIDELVICRMRKDDKVRECTFEIADKIGVLLNYSMCAFFSALGTSRFEKGVAKIQEFDVVTNTGMKINLLENLVAAVAVVVIWSLVGWIFADFSVPTEKWQIFYLIAIGVLSLEIYKFCFIFMALSRRFVRFRKIVSSRKIFINSTENLYCQPLTVHDIFTIHRGLVDAVENFNKYFDVRIVYWFCYFIISLIMQAFIAADDSSGLQLNPRQIARLAFTIYHPTMLCAFAHFTPKRANELRRLLFGRDFSSLETRNLSHGKVEFGLYLQKKPLIITGLRLFPVDLPLLLTMIQACVAYTTFILQAVVEEYNDLARAKLPPNEREH